ncbi:dTDP-4-dehydrorhamnose reductase [Eubacterium xylanophilum]|uniref:dTDP-4-dehydrorhamnose reductase n=1 Tax=Eubacterium xylanophilum TaxID=39497 RepID=UPI00047A4E46|nr:dTDP-4-dehydrorhamnose reductase [Eubacterium xylanophilum]
MKIFVTGVAGQLGNDILKVLDRRGDIAVGSDIVETCENIPTSASYVALDITDADQVRNTLLEHKPDAIIHCAAWTAVDAAEDEENREMVYAINAGGTENIAVVAREIGAKMLYISTDYVFDGEGTKPWDPDDKNYNPLCVYGDSKLKGELAVAENVEKFFVTRISWVFGANGNNFVKTMLNVGERFDTLKVVDDQIGLPTYTPDLSELLVDMIKSDKYGYYHVSNEGDYISWYDFAKEIFKVACEMGHSNYSPERLTVNAVSTEEYGVSKAKRPFNSRLDKSKLVKNGFKLLPDWKDALRRYMEEYYGTDNC